MRESVLFAVALGALACGSTRDASDSATPGTSSSTADGAMSGAGAAAVGVGTSTGGAVGTTAAGSGGSLANSNGGGTGTGEGSVGGGDAVGGAASGATGSAGGTGGASGSGGGTGDAGGSGGSSGGGASGGTAGTTGSGGTAGAMAAAPCDLFEAAGTPCVAAYSMVRRLFSAYSGPLYQVRSDSSVQNIGSGGETHDIGFTEAGLGDAAAQDAVCGDSVCTVSLLYDQSGRGNHLVVAPKGDWWDQDLDNFESLADSGAIRVGGHDVYSLYMEQRQAYRLPMVGDGVPVGDEAQGIYLLADGTRYGTACCWEFGNISPEPLPDQPGTSLFFGVGFWGRGEGDGPWFLAHFDQGVWAGGSTMGDPGWGMLNADAPPNTENPPLAAPFALGFLSTDDESWALRMADAEAATSLTTAYEGALPLALDNLGGIGLGVSGENGASSLGTFYEGAVVAGRPTEQVEQQILENIQSAGYF